MRCRTSEPVALRGPSPVVQPFRQAIDAAKSDPREDRSAAESFQKRSLEEADRLACGLRAAREWLALPLARAAQEFVRQSAWQPFGYARLDDFTRERLGRSGRWLRDLASLQAGLDAFSELAAVMVGRDGARPLGRVATLWISRTACAESLSAWVRVARSGSVRELHEQVRTARSAGSHTPLGMPPACTHDRGEDSEVMEPARLGVVDTEAEAEDLQRRCRGHVAVPAPVRIAFDEALDLYRAISGSETSVASFVDALTAEWESALPVRSVCEPSGDVTLAARRRERRREEKERALDCARRRKENEGAFDRARDSGRGSDGGPDAATAAADVLRRVQRLSFEAWRRDPTPRELADKLQSLVQLEDEIERRLGRLLADMQGLGAWSSLGFASLGHYAAERLGLGRRTIETRAALARALSIHPILREAYERGRLGLESALLVRRALGSGRVDAQLEREWTEHASHVTVKRLRDELRLLGRRAVGLKPEDDLEESVRTPAPASTGAPRSRFPLPPSDAAWHASLFRVPGVARERLARLGAIAIDSSANDRLALELPEDVAQRFFAAVEGARLLLVELVASRVAGEAAPASLRAAQTFSRTGEPVPAWAGLLAVLEHFVDTWDRPEHVPRREWDPIYRRDGYRCMAPGCTARADLQAHHVWYRSHQGPDEAWNILCLCWLHHQEGEHGELARVRGVAPLGLIWRLGTKELASWYRNERRLDRTPEMP